MITEAQRYRYGISLRRTLYVWLAVNFLHNVRPVHICDDCSRFTGLPVVFMLEGGGQIQIIWVGLVVDVLAVFAAAAIVAWAWNHLSSPRRESAYKGSAKLE